MAATLGNATVSNRGSEVIKIPDQLLDRSELDFFCRRLRFKPRRETFAFGDAPEPLLALVPYAEIWGLDFEDWRQEARENTPSEFNAHLWWVRLHSGAYDQMEDWLTGEAANQRPLSRAYIAFSCLNMTLSELD
jgi:hypothetical protein